jgi:hypothetical protein
MLTALGTTLGAADIAPGEICTTKATWLESIGVGAAEGAVLGVPLGAALGAALARGTGLWLEPLQAAVRSVPPANTPSRIPRVKRASWSGIQSIDLPREAARGNRPLISPVKTFVPRAKWGRTSSFGAACGGFSVM